MCAAHSPDKASDIRASANVLDLVGSGFGKGAIGVTYRRDLDAMPVSVIYRVHVPSASVPRLELRCFFNSAALKTSSNTHR